MANRRVTGHVEKRGKRGWCSMVLDYGEVWDTSTDPPTLRRKRIREAIPLPPGQDHITKADAEAILRARLVDLNRGLLPEDTRETVADYLRAWLRNSCEPRLRPSTVVGYRNSIEKHIIPRLGPLPLPSLEPSHLRGLYAAMREEGLAPRTIELTHVVLHGALSQAVKDGKLFRNVADAVEPPRPRRNIARTLEPDQIAQLLATAEGTPLYELVVLALHCGLRRSELLALEWEDVNLKERYLTITKGLTVADRQLIVREPKTQQSTRIIPLDQEALDALLRLRRRSTHPLVFCGPDGKHMNPGTVSKQFTELARKAGFPGLRLHDLRHTFATLMLRAGVGLKYASTLLGHSSIKTTGDIYAHAIPEDLRRAVETYSKALATNGWHRSGTDQEA